MLCWPGTLICAHTLWKVGSSYFRLYWKCYSVGGLGFFVLLLAVLKQEQEKEHWHDQEDCGSSSKAPCQKTSCCIGREIERKCKLTQSWGRDIIRRENLSQVEASLGNALRCTRADLVAPILKPREKLNNFILLLRSSVWLLLLISLRERPHAHLSFSALFLSCFRLFAFPVDPSLSFSFPSWLDTEGMMRKRVM